MLVPEVFELVEYWAEEPPLHLLVNAILKSFVGSDGRTPASSGGPAYATEEELRAAVQMFKER